MSLGGVVGGGENLNPKGVLLVKVWVILVTLMSPPAVKTGLLSPCVAIWVSLFSTRLTRQFATMLTIDAMMDNTSASTLTLYSTPKFLTSILLLYNNHTSIGLSTKLSQYFTQNLCNLRSIAAKGLSSKVSS